MCPKLWSNGNRSDDRIKISNTLNQQSSHLRLQNQKGAVGFKKKKKERRKAARIQISISTITSKGRRNPILQKLKKKRPDLYHCFIAGFVDRYTLDLHKKSKLCKGMLSSPTKPESVMCGK